MQAEQSTAEMQQYEEEAQGGDEEMEVRANPILVPQKYVKELTGSLGLLFFFVRSYLNSKVWRFYKNMVLLQTIFKNFKMLAITLWNRYVPHCEIQENLQLSFVLIIDFLCLFASM